MKICVISFDFWGYDAHIVETLKEKGIEANHIKIGAVSYENFGERLTNLFSKVFLGKNLKYQKRQKFVIEQLDKLGHQDQILVLNNGKIEQRGNHEELMKQGGLYKTLISMKNKATIWKIAN